MVEHHFDLGDIVTIFQMSPAKGLLIEGRAAIVAKVPDVDEYYIIRFRDDEGTYQRFVDRFGQENPQQYIREFNAKIGIRAKSE
jgi:hypothetical protein